jgi:hypothetical protein
LPGRGEIDGAGNDLQALARLPFEEPHRRMLVQPEPGLALVEVNLRVAAENRFEHVPFAQRIAGLNCSIRSTALQNQLTAIDSRKSWHRRFRRVNDKPQTQADQKAGGDGASSSGESVSSR